MKKALKKTIALAVALCMTLGTAVPAFAAESGASVQSGVADKAYGRVFPENSSREKENTAEKTGEKTDGNVTEKDKHNEKIPGAKDDVASNAQKTEKGEQAPGSRAAVAAVLGEGAVVSSVVGEHLSDMAGEIVNNVTEMALEDFNSVTGDPVSEGLVTLLGGATGRALVEIEDEISETQDMIREVQASIDALATDMKNSFDEIRTEQYKQDLGERTMQLDKYASQFEDLNNMYSNVISHLYVNGRIKDTLTDADWARIYEFIQQINDTKPANILSEISALTNPASSDPLYEVYMTYLTSDTSFRHKTYMNMYYMVNYVSQLRSTALTFIKEQEAYKQMQQFALREGKTIAECYNEGLLKDFRPDFDDYMRLYYNDVINDTNEEMSENHVFGEMADIFRTADLPPLPDRDQYDSDAEWSAAVDRYLDSSEDALKDAIDASILTTMDTYDKDGDRVTEDAYKLTSNEDDSTYYISLEKHEMGEYVNYRAWEEDREALGITVYYQDVTVNYGPCLTTDGRYLIPSDAEGLKGLFGKNTGTDQLSWLIGETRDSDGFSQLTPDMKIILTTGTGSGSYRNGETTFDIVQLLDAGDFDPESSTEQYLTFEDHQMNAYDIHFGEEYRFAGDEESSAVEDTYVLRIFAEQGVTADKDGVIKPAVKENLPSRFNLNDGQTLDLSTMTETDLDKTVTVTGDVVIYGAGKKFTDLNVYLFDGADLTLKDITLRGSDHKIRAYGKDVIMRADGAVVLETTEGGRMPVYAYEQCETLTLAPAEGAGQEPQLMSNTEGSGDEPAIQPGFNIIGSNIDDKDAAVYTVNSLIIDGADVYVKSKTDKTIKGGAASEIKNAKIKSVADKEGNGEITLGDGSSITGSTLDLSFGGINGKITKSDNTFTNKVRYQIKVKTGNVKNAGTDDEIGLLLVNKEDPDMLLFNNLGHISGDQFEKGKTDEFEFSIDSNEYEKFIYSDNIKKMKFFINGDDGWYVEYADIISSADSYSEDKPDGSTFYFYTWIDDSESYTSNIGDIAGVMTIDTADEKNAGTASKISVDFYSKDQTDTPFMRIGNITSRTKDAEFSAGSLIEIPFVVRETSLRDMSGLSGVRITSDHSGSAAGWKLHSINVKADTVYGNVNMTAEPDQWFLKANQKCYFGLDDESTGAVKLMTKTSGNSNAGTDSNFQIRIETSMGNTDWLEFNDFCENRSHDCMEKGMTDEFHIAFDSPIDKEAVVEAIKIKTDMSGSGPTWECDTIKLTVNGRAYDFSVYSKLGDEDAIYTFEPDGSSSVSSGYIQMNAGKYDTDELRKLLEGAANKTSLHVTSANGSGLLDGSIIRQLLSSGKTMIIEHMDAAKENMLYQWILRGADMGAVSGDLSLKAAVGGTEMAKAWGVNASGGVMALDLSKVDKLPEGVSINLNGKLHGFDAGQKVYMYSLDSAGRTLTLMDSSLTSDYDGNILMNVKGGERLLLTDHILTADEGAGIVIDNGDTADKSPATGDEIPVYIWISLIAIVLVAVIAVIAMLGRRKRS